MKLLININNYSYEDWVEREHVNLLGTDEDKIFYFDYGSLLCII